MGGIRAVPLDFEQLRWDARCPSRTQGVCSPGRLRVQLRKPAAGHPWPAVRTPVCTGRAVAFSGFGSKGKSQQQEPGTDVREPLFLLDSHGVFARDALLLQTAKAVGARRGGSEPFNGAARTVPVSAVFPGIQ